MHNQKDNNSGGEHKGMMWMMLVCCLAPVVILLGGTTFLRSTPYVWVGIALIGGFIVFRLRYMFRPHGNQKEEEITKENKESENHKSCCH